MRWLLFGLPVFFGMATEPAVAAGDTAKGEMVFGRIVTKD